MTAERTTLAAATPSPCVVAFATRETTRAAFRRAFPRRRARLVLARTAKELEAVFRSRLVDAALIDVEHAVDETWRAAALAREFPSAPFFGVTPYRGADASAIARCAALELTDVLAHGVDDAAMREIVLRDAFTARFARALHTAPPQLGFEAPLQQEAWGLIVQRAGRAVHTALLARALGLTREHLSRRFSSEGAPNLKRVVDLVRLLAAAELAKNPGYDLADVAMVLEFASLSHLSTTAYRITGTRPASLARLRAVDLVKRFSDGRARSRARR